MLLTLAAFLVVLGVLILVHEAGHFFAAKAVGVQVLRFSLGFGPPLLRWQRGETEYWICAVPLGGYVKMAGLEEQDQESIADKLEGGSGAVPIDPARAFDRKSVPARLVVMLAGVTMNALLAFALFTGLDLGYGRAELGTTTIDSVAASRLPEGAAEFATLPFGTEVTAVNTGPVRTWDDLVRAVLEGPDTVRVQVAGRRAAVVAVLADSAGRLALLRALTPAYPARLAVVEPGRPARRAGMRPGDLIIRVEGDTVRSWGDLVRFVRPRAGQALRFEVSRGDTVHTFTATPDERIVRDSAGARTSYGIIGAQVDQPIVRVRQGVGAAVASGWEQTGRSAMAIVHFLGRLVSGQESVRELGGPILIGQISGQMVRLGLDRFLWFLAFFSVQLAVLNLLPIPVLDGGHVVFLLAEAVRGKPVSLALRIRLLNFGFWLLMLIMLLAVGNDVIFRLFR